MRKKLQKYIHSFGILILILFSFSCANIVAPTGGPKDITPPKVKFCDPVNFSSNFKYHKIRITFNEFILLEDQANQIVVSPPPKEEFDYIVRGKSIIINLPKVLKDTLTYTIYFGESIRDITENNILSGLEYAFSTGSYIDSLSIIGDVSDAYTLEPGKSVYVMLYRSLSDSVPLKQKPDYITKTNAAGSFVLNNLASGHYKIIALSDLNSDFLYNQSNEAIAFDDSLATPFFIPRKLDSTSTKKDSLKIKKDSTIQQSTITRIHLRLFTQTDSVQKLLQARSNKYGQFKLYFKYPVSNLSINIKNKKLEQGWKLDEYSPNRDTLTCWLTNPVDIDTLKFTVSINGIVFDSVELALKQKMISTGQQKKPSGKGTLADDNANKPVISYNAKSTGLFPFFLPLKIYVSNPVKYIDSSKIILSEKIDSSFKSIPFKVYMDESNLKHNFLINHSWTPKSKYQILVLPGAFKDIYGNENDSSKVNFTPNTVEDYGRLLFTLKSNNSQSPFVIQLLGENKIVLSEKTVTRTEQIIFENLAPGNYYIRIIKDLNNNGKWDSGDYFKKHQPEPVFSFPNMITIRANWDSDFEFTL
ncbi:MAG: Ig-like domain-containing protein [Bacteroidota bacterium]